MNPHLQSFNQILLETQNRRKKNLSVFYHHMLAKEPMEVFGFNRRIWHQV